MKKIYTVIVAVAALSFSLKAQQESFEKTNNVAHQINYSYATANDNIVSTQISVIGNPVRDILTLQIANPNSTKYELSLYSSAGRKVTAESYEHPAGVSTKQIYVSQLPPGIYHLVILNQYERKSVEIIKQ
ncbi:MAG: T9SS type A sorting domain-containing protein [Parafilimonas sp.]|nr:T9SS type A sorting domain-containing protein [Parafilimonas sp.]